MANQDEKIISKLECGESQFKMDILKVKEKVLKDCRLSRKSIDHINSLLNHFMSNLMKDAEDLRKRADKPKIGEKEVKCALELQGHRNPILKNI